MLDLTIGLEFLEELKKGRNLLAFSGGVDSSALYFLLQSYGISFDIAIVDYGIRKQSSLEVSYAQNLCFRDNKQCFVKYAPKIQGNFESYAREFRYDFFETLVIRFGYNNLILAHQLNDALEWFLMQFCKGTSVQKMQMPSKYQKNYIKNIHQGKLEATYWILRPFWQTSRAQIFDYLQNNQIFYFEDFSNHDMRLRRNYFRIKFANTLLEEFHNGIAFSLKLLQEESQRENEKIKDEVFEIPLLGKFCVLELKTLQNGLEAIDFVCKICGVLLSRAQKLELNELLEVERFSRVFKHQITIEKVKDQLFIFPHQCKRVIPKVVREKYRMLGIPQKFRFFLFQARILGMEQKVLDKIKKPKEEE